MSDLDAAGSWETIDAALIRMRRLFAAPQDVGGGVDVSAMLIVDTIARRERSGEWTRIGDVATSLNVKPSTASRLVGSAEQAGFIARSASLGDTRSVLLELTGAGVELNATAREFRISSLRESLPRWDAGTVASFALLLDEFSRASVSQS